MVWRVVFGGAQSGSPNFVCLQSLQINARLSMRMVLTQHHEWSVVRADLISNLSSSRCMASEEIHSELDLIAVPKLRCLPQRWPQHVLGALRRRNWGRKGPFEMLWCRQTAGLMDNPGSCKPYKFKACICPGNKNLLKIILPGRKKT